MVNGIVLKKLKTLQVPLKFFCSNSNYEILRSLKHWKSIQDITGVNKNFKLI